MRVMRSLRVAELWRYPVKSLQGERVEAVDVTHDGLTGDRRYAIFERATGLGLTGRRVPGLLYASAAWQPDGSVRITLPDGTFADDDAALSRWLGRDVELRSVEDDVPRRYENPEDPDQEATGQWVAFTGAPGPFHDSARIRVSLVSRTTLGAWDRRRFRANVLLDGAGEDDLVGGQAMLGPVRLEVTKRIGRCVMTTRPQPGGIEADPSVLRTIARERDACLAIGALVLVPGRVSIGDSVTEVADPASVPVAAR